MSAAEIAASYACKAAREVMAEVDAFREAGPGDGADWMARRGDIGMEAANALWLLLAEIDNRVARESSG